MILRIKVEDVIEAINSKLESSNDYKRKKSFSKGSIEVTYELVFTEASICLFIYTYIQLQGTHYKNSLLNCLFYLFE